MPMQWTEIERILVAKQVDLSEIKSAMVYVASGFTLSSGFKVVKKSGVASLTKKKVDAIRTVVNSRIGGSKKKLRLCIPMLISLLVGYAIGDSKEAIGQYISEMLGNRLNSTDLAATLKILNGIMKDSFYTSYMNRELDPFVEFFGGSKPNSFSKAVVELVAYINTPALQEPSAPPVRQPGVIPPPPPALERVPSTSGGGGVTRVTQTQPRVSPDVAFTEVEGARPPSDETYTVIEKQSEESKKATTKNGKGTKGARRYSALVSLFPVTIFAVVSYVAVTKAVRRV